MSVNSLPNPLLLLDNASPLFAKPSPLRPCAASKGAFTQTVAAALFNIWNPAREHSSWLLVAKPQCNSIQFDSIQFYYYTSILLYFCQAVAIATSIHKRSTLIDFRCLCHLLFNIWNPVREHNSCISYTSIHFNSILLHFNSILLLHLYTTTPKFVSHCRLRRRRLYGLVSSPRRGPVRFAPGSPSPPPSPPPPSLPPSSPPPPSPPGIVNFVSRVPAHQASSTSSPGFAGSGVATGAKVREDTGVAPQCNSLTSRSHRFWLHLWLLAWPPPPSAQPEHLHRRCRFVGRQLPVPS